MSEWKMRRFWKEAAVVPEETGGYRIELDGRPVRTPAKAVLTVPTEDFAEAVRAEWNAQDEEIRPLSMPATRAANVAIDRVSVQKEEVVSMLAAYGDADLLCYRADSPEELIERQALAWDPLLDWAHERYGARLIPVQGVIHAAQSEDALARLEAPLRDMGAFELTAAHDLITLTGSLVLGLAACERLLEADDVWKRSRIDEDWQIEQWGPDEEAERLAVEREGAFQNAFRLFHMLTSRT